MPHTMRRKLPLSFDIGGYTISRDFMGHYTLQDNETGASCYIQGESAKAFERDVTLIPVKLLPIVFQEYAPLMA